MQNFPSVTHDVARNMYQIHCSRESPYCDGMTNENIHITDGTAHETKPNTF